MSSPLDTPHFSVKLSTFHCMRQYYQIYLSRRLSVSWSIVRYKADIKNIEKDKREVTNVTNEPKRNIMS